MRLRQVLFATEYRRRYKFRSVDLFGRSNHGTRRYRRNRKADGNSSTEQRHRRPGDSGAFFYRGKILPSGGVSSGHVMPLLRTLIGISFTVSTPSASKCTSITSPRLTSLFQY